MAVTNFTPLLGLALPTTGDLSGTWGTTVNTAITDLLDDAVAGTVTLSADADVTLTTTNGADNQARNAVILWTASNGATTRNITAPAQSKAYVVINAGTGSVVIRGSGPTTGVTVISGEKCLVAWNGSDFVKISTTEVDGVSTISFGSTGLTPSTATSGAVTVAGTLAVANGGTGATTAPNALTNLAAAGTGISNTFTANQIVEVTDNTNAALRITQLGTGNALLVEDSTNPDATPFVIDATGKVGIGTTAPLVDLHIQANTSAGVLNYTAGGGTSYLFRRSSGTTSAPTIVASGDTIAATAYQGYDGASYLSAAQIIGAVDGTPGTNDMPGRLVFATTADGASSPTERMRIDSAGQIGVGGASTAGVNFRLAKSLTGSTNAYSAQTLGTIQSDVTGAAWGVLAQLNTAAASFSTQTRLFQASQGTIGVGSTLSNQTGFYADASLTGATNNYGFYGNIASGANRYNLYMNGTADNYLGGATTINTNSTTDALRITQLGSGNALLVEDSTNPDASPFVIDANGFVIQGKTTSFSALGYQQAIEVYGQSGTFGQYRYSDNISGTELVWAKSRSATLGTNTIVQSGDALGILRAAGADGTNFVEAARITASVDGTPGTNDMPGRLVFATTADGASSPTERMRIDSVGNVGIGGTASTATKVHSQANATGATTAIGFLSSSQVQTDVTASYRAFQSTLSTAAAFTLTDSIGLAVFQGTYSGTVTNNFGISIAASLTGATNNYGFYSNIASGTNRYNLYMAGTADNYMAGRLGIGATAGSDTSILSGKNITGATVAFGFRQLGSIQSDVTSQANGIQSAVSTAAASFTLTNLRNFFASQGTIGATSSVTNQYGFFADSGLTGATNNFGFYGDIASGAGRFNLYMAGTAANRFNGDLLVYGGTAIPAGGTTGSGYKLSSTANFGVFFGSGAPTLSAAKGSLYLRSDGTTTNNRMYVNTDGSTTWTAVTTAA